MKTKLFYISSFLTLITLLLGSLIYLHSNSKQASLNNLYPVTELVVVKILPCDYSKKSDFTDARDGKSYRQVQIGNQCWMAENLNYGKLVKNMEQSNNKIPEKSFYQNDTSLGRKMGALYTWEEAVNYSITPENNFLQGLCPDGWHIPSDAEWNMLASTLDPSVDSKKEGWSGKNIAILLLESDNSGVNFNSRLSGNAVSGWFFYLNKMSYFWTSTPYSSSSAWYRSLTTDSKQIYRGPGDIMLGMSVRCLKD